MRIFSATLLSIFLIIPVGKPLWAANSLVFDAALVVENDVEIKTRLTGIIEKIYVDRGSRVRKGDPLAVLDNRDLSLEIKKAEVNLQEAKAEYDRAKSLFDQRLLSESEFDSRRLAYDAKSAELGIAKINYEKSIIRAPFPGIVVERYAKIGQRVVDDENVALFRVTAMEPLLAKVFVPEEKLSEISVGMKSEFVPSVWPDRKFVARVKWISSTIDPASGTAPAIIELNTGEGKGVLKPGTSGKVIILPKATSATKP
jgi:membrane fusion protein (multidrug efflux system)